MKEQKMNKIFAGILAVSMTAGLVSAQEQTNVLSRNAVGYVKVDVQPAGKLHLISDPFLLISDSGPKTLAEIFPLGSGFKASPNVPANSDSAILWNVESQTYSTYGQKASDGLFYAKTAWGGAPFTDELPVGTAVWLQTTFSSSQPTNVVLMGEVPADRSLTLQVAGSVGSSPLTFLANPYPVEMALIDFLNQESGVVGSTVPALADTVTLWDQAAQAYLTYGLRLNALGPGVHEWRLKNAWGTSPAEVVKLVPGQGFIYQRISSAGAFDLEIDRPYTWPN
jgi:hypothetical protein